MQSSLRLKRAIRVSLRPRRRRRSVPLRLPQDKRFRAADWQRFPFNLYAHSFLSIERWWEMATTGIRGVSKQHENALTFAARQLLDIAAPSNFFMSNPTALSRTISTQGMNVVRGYSNLAEDLMRAAAGQGPAESDAFKVGEKVAVTPGQGRASRRNCGWRAQPANVFSIS
jgi:polyhydroxyalkanoate synthase